MKTILAFTLLVSSTISFAQTAPELKILAWYKLNNAQSRDISAEVCFSVKPAPQTPTLVEITVDKGTNAQGNYTTWITSKGSACHVVATARGRVEVSLPEAKVSNEIHGFLAK